MLSTMESNQISRDEARAALDAVDAIERQTHDDGTPEVWPTAAVGALFGAAVVMTLMETNWVFLLLVLTVVIAAGILLHGRNRKVRASYKQPVQEDSGGSTWLAVLAPILTFSVVTILPRGNWPIALAAGAVSAIVMGAAMWHDTKPHGGSR